MSAYDIAKAARNQIEAEHQAAVAHLKRISGTERGPMGLTPDHVKDTPEWQDAYRKERDLFRRLRAVNAQMAGRFSKEMREERSARRATSCNVEE